jgi:uncharacterized protein YfcZ (UPF0381/DUF406 family)
MPSNDAFRENFDRIFGKKKRAEDAIESIRRKARETGADKLTSDEIDAEIDAARKDRR